MGSKGWEQIGHAPGSLRGVLFETSVFTSRWCGPRSSPLPRLDKQPLLPGPDGLLPLSTLDQRAAFGLVACWFDDCRAASR
eukprot:11171432-Lingulodinium_polyedra.AAC.1